ncbi:low-affinity Zn(2+) transporter zrt2 [Elasticomyces elasticus]|nr:low-affinity Zn(2+) transporter zrt2 [Elasticomyces elasticus]KAK3668262.1 low-affinity Zn(2+) transporter zrt2 [Elasticomyces elasticus]KAK4922753.1 low-affinity Zn(2+) transporter zrt2 [Elasticomyces elasticus]KAK5769414.1 low-affinity Zn(2+) transporter zrt2 [Elasticomyces elasticus]
MTDCTIGNEYNGSLGPRISSVFVILFGSFLGAWSPVFAARHRSLGVPEWLFFVARYFGSGVILATAFIHLLGPANDALNDPCLIGVITEYPWAEGICLMAVFLMFLVELVTMRYARLSFAQDHDIEQTDHGRANRDSDALPNKPFDGDQASEVMAGVVQDYREEPAGPQYGTVSSTAGRLQSSHQEADELFDSQSYRAHLTAIAVLDFGIIFHSIFIGLTLAVAGEEFQTLYIVLVFHQTFEGLAVGTRVAAVDWPKSTKWTPYMLIIAYAISTPLGIAVGLGVRPSFSPGSQNTLITNGVFDSISAGILIFTGLIELMGRDFLFSDRMQKAPLREVTAAVGCMCLGAGLMALIGFWA